MLDIENLEEKFQAIVETDGWRSVERSFAEAKHVFMFGNGGNMGISDHMAIDMSRLTDKNVHCPGSAVLATSIISDTNFEDWFKHWLTIRMRGLDPSECLVIGLSCSTIGASSNSIVKALDAAGFAGAMPVLIAANPKLDDTMHVSVRRISQGVKHYHTSEILSLILGYQLIHSAGFTCPTIKKKDDERKSLTGLS